MKMKQIVGLSNSDVYKSKFVTAITWTTLYKLIKKILPVNQLSYTGYVKWEEGKTPEFISYSYIYDTWHDAFKKRRPFALCFNGKSGLKFLRIEYDYKEEIYISAVYKDGFDTNNLPNVRINLRYNHIAYIDNIYYIKQHEPIFRRTDE